MNNDRVYLVILLVVAIVVLSNLLMFAMVRGARHVRLDWFRNARDALGRPFGREDDSLDELRERVAGLSSQKDAGEQGEERHEQ